MCQGYRSNSHFQNARIGRFLSKIFPFYGFHPTGEKTEFPEVLLKLGNSNSHFEKRP